MNYSYDHIDTAIVITEYITDLHHQTEKSDLESMMIDQVNELRGAAGSAELRSAIIAFSVRSDKSYTKIITENDRDAFDMVGCWDFDFIPAHILQLVESGFTDNWLTASQENCDAAAVAIINPES